MDELDERLNRCLLFLLPKAKKMLGKIIAIALIALVVVVGYTLSGMYGNTYEIKGTVVKTWIDPVDGGSAYLVKIKLEDGRHGNPFLVSRFRIAVKTVRVFGQRKKRSAS